MKKLLKGAIIFTSGVSVGLVAGGLFVVTKMLQNEYILNSVAKSICDRTFTFLSDDKHATSYRKVDSVVFDTRLDAEKVLDELKELLSKYGIVTLCDLYDLTGIVRVDYTSTKYGWTNLDNAKIVLDKGRYSIELPKAFMMEYNRR